MTRPLNVASVFFPRETLAVGRDVRRETLRHLKAVGVGLRGLRVDLAVFSEGVEAMAQTVAQAEALDDPGPVLQCYRDLAQAVGCHVAGSVKLREGKRVHNSIAFLGPDGQALGAYHKTFLTDPELEEGLCPGGGAVVVDTAIGRLGGVVCFDLNFAELRKQYAALKPDILVFPSMYHGGLAQGEWAYGCRAFFISALPYYGGGVLDPFGRPVVITSSYTPVAIAAINLDRVMVHLDGNRQKFPDIQRRYGDEVLIDIPPHIGPALIYSRSAQRTARDIVREFELVLLDDYLRGSVSHNRRRRSGPLRRRVVATPEPGSGRQALE